MSSSEVIAKNSIYISKGFNSYFNPEINAQWFNYNLEKVKGHSAAFTVASFVAVVKAGPYLTFLSIYVLTRL